MVGAVDRDRPGPDAETHEAGVGIALDLNWRPGLPVGEDEWAYRLVSVVEDVDFVKATVDEWGRLTRAGSDLCRPPNGLH